MQKYIFFPDNKFSYASIIDTTNEGLHYFVIKRDKIYLLIVSESELCEHNIMQDEYFYPVYINESLEAVMDVCRQLAQVLDAFFIEEVSVIVKESET